MLSSRPFAVLDLQSPLSSDACLAETLLSLARQLARQSKSTMKMLRRPDLQHRPVQQLHSSNQAHHAVFCSCAQVNMTEFVGLGPGRARSKTRCSELFFLATSDRRVGLQCGKLAGENSTFTQVPESSAHTLQSPRMPLQLDYAAGLT